MTAVLWKEIRENLKWAVLWLLGVAAATAYVFYVPQAAECWRNAESLCKPTFLMVMLFGAAAGGALLGLLQTAPETRRDRWAFLIHRPATRTRLFLGKVFGGLLLLLPAMGIPLVGAALWAATPGHIAAPFDWRMVLPGIADILVGIVFYFGGLLTGLRPARWYASRALGIAAAVPCALFVGVVPEFWHALLIIIGCGAVLGLAAWGSFLTAGAYGAQPRLAKVALGIILLAGILVAGSVVVGAALVARSVEQAPSWTQYGIDVEGDIVRVTQEYGTLAKITDLDGNEIEKSKYGKTQRDVQDKFLPVSYLLMSWHSGSAGYQDPSRYFRALGWPAGTWWYYVTAEGRIRGYSQRDKRCIGVIGPDGFAPVGAPEGQAFDGPPLTAPWSESGLLAFSRAVYQVDLAARRVTHVFSADPGDGILGTAQLGKQGKDYSLAAQVVATRDHIVILGADGGLRLKVPYHYDIQQQYSAVQVAMTPDEGRYFIWYSSFPMAETGLTLARADHIVELAADGTELKRHDLPPLPRPPAGSLWPQVVCAAAVPASAVILGAAIATLVARATGSPSPDLTFVFGEAGPEASRVAIANMVSLGVSALICATLCLLLARRHAFGKRATVGWTIGGLFLGPAGMLMLIALRDWPAREPCPACGRKRVVDRDTCARCGAPFPPPAPNGTQIFDT